MPAWNERRDICLIFSGEHFADSSEGNQLRAAGHSISAHDAACLVHLYEERGERFFEALNGAFSGVILDLRKERVILFNDRFGLGRVYYHEDRDGLYFASEAKALLRVLPQLRKLDLRSFGEFFSCGCALQDRTLFSGVSLLPAGSAWVFEPNGRTAKIAYFTKESWEHQAPLPQAEYYERLKGTFSRTLPKFLNGNRPVGMSLTGGLDSRMIMAWARCEPGRMPCFTHSGIYREPHDARISREVARVCGQPYQIVPVDNAFLKEFPDLAQRSVYVTDGAMDVSGAVGLFVNRLDRQIAPIRMTGNYGSEILRWLVAFSARSQWQQIFSEEFMPRVEESIQAYTLERSVGTRPFIAFKQVPWHHYARFGLEQSQLTIRSPYLDNELVGLAFRAPPALADNQDLAARLISDGNPALCSFPTDRGPLGRNGVLGRLAETWHEFTFKAEYAYDYGMPQWMTRIDRVLSAFRFERMFLGRHKYYHFRVWYRKELAGFVREVLLDSKSLSRPYLDARGVQNLVQAHTSGRGNYTTEIHKLLSAELLQRQLLEQN
jgi:asparagine synthase (glutamine-hydrolysing)